MLCYKPRPGTVIVDSSEFFHQIPRRDTITDAHRLGVTWLFNNNGLALKSEEEPVATVDIPEAGLYTLHVRAHAAVGSGFRIALGDSTSATAFGTDDLRLETGGTLALPAGPLTIKLTAIAPVPVFDVLALTLDPSFTLAELEALQYAADVALLHEYQLPPVHAVKFGDLTGDGRIGFVALTPNYSAFAFDHDGNALWHYDAPEADTVLRAEFEAPGTIWDFDGDGVAEVVHWRMIGGAEYLVMADGRTGEVKRKTPWPTTPMPHVYNNFRTAVARLRPGRADCLVVFTDSGGTMTISAYDPDLQELWRDTRTLKKDHLGHYLYPVDLNGDGVDELLVGYLALDSQGRELWNRFDLFPDHHEHIDDIKFADLDGDGELEAVVAQSDIGAAVYKAATGELLWTRPAEHAQQITLGDFYDNAQAPQIVVTARIYGNRKIGEPVISGQTYWYDPQGNLLTVWPPHGLNGNPDFVNGNWLGDGRASLFWYKFQLGRDGRGTLAFPDPVYHMFDFEGNGAEQVITLDNPRGLLRVYGAAAVAPLPKARDEDYRRQVMANHTHY